MWSVVVVQLVAFAELVVRFRFNPLMVFSRSRISSFMRSIFVVPFVFFSKIDTINIST